MYRALARLIVAAAFVFGGIYVYNYSHQPPHQAPANTSDAQSPALAPLLPEAKQAQSMVTFAGPLADYVSHEQPLQGEAPRGPYKPSAEDHIEDSPVGGRSRIVHRTFSVGRAVHISFEIPPHAVTPRFHGTFRAVGQQAAAPRNGEGASVDMLLMNEQQYAEFSSGLHPEVLFIADTSHFQDINFDLSPSFDHPVRYHLIFRGSPGGLQKKVVQADLSVDF
jgi:hypothetical protein